ncbi:MAG TPA: chemotaxis protein CheW [Leptolyngbyaceae cyanobacterium]
MLDPQTNWEPYILFELADSTYGIPAHLVQQMEMLERITPVPNAPLFLEGVVFSRGKMIPAVNLRVKFGLDKIAYNLRSRLIVVNIANRSIGLIVDSAREFVNIPHDALKPPPEGISELSAKYLSGIALWENRVILVLNLPEIVNVNGRSLVEMG